MREAAPGWRSPAESMSRSFSGAAPPICVETSAVIKDAPFVTAMCFLFSSQRDLKTPLLEFQSGAHPRPGRQQIVTDLFFGSSKERIGIGSHRERNERWSRPPFQSRRTPTAWVYG